MSATAPVTVTFSARRILLPPLPRRFFSSGCIFTFKTAPLPNDTLRVIIPDSGEHQDPFALRHVYAVIAIRIGRSGFLGALHHDGSAYQGAALFIGYLTGNNDAGRFNRGKSKER